MLKTVLFWDIDGTLLTTRRAGITAWEKAAEAVLGRPVDLTEYPTAGGTDHAIALRMLKDFGGETARAMEMTRIYEDGLPVHLPSRQGKVLEGVREILEAAERRADILSLLLTGNTPAGAKAKLNHYGLAQFFPHGAFSEAVDEGREAIARRAYALADRIAGPLEAERCYVIGDTPHDIACGKAIGARTIAVATGVHALEELERHSPWWAVAALPAPDVFFARIGCFATR